MEQEQLVFIEAARATGVKHIVKLSGRGASLHAATRLGRWHGAGDAALEGSGIGYTLLKPSVFMQNLLYTAPLLVATGLLEMPCAGARVALVDARDIAEAAAIALASAVHKGRTYEITGPSALTYKEVCALLSVACGRTVEYRDVDRERAALIMVENRMLGGPT